MAVRIDSFETMGCLFRYSVDEVWGRAALTYYLQSLLEEFTKACEKEGFVDD